jgi:8-oxo-dGTP diphosphatase
MSSGDRPTAAGLPRRQRVAAYAVIARSGQVLLSRIAPSVTPLETWTLPGGGLEFGEPPADAVVREVREETGLDCVVGDVLWVGSAHRVVDRGTDGEADMHSVRIVYEAWVPADAPEPRVVEVDGSTVDARWVPIEDVEAGLVPTAPMVLEALASYRPATRQRLAAYALVVREDQVLLTRNSARGPHPGRWTLPGGGLLHGETPGDAVAREVLEETGLAAEVGDLLGVHDEHFTGTAPGGREEDYHGVHLVFAAEVSAGAPAVRDPDGTTDAVAWLPLDQVEVGEVPVSTVVAAALAMPRAHSG